MGSTGSATVLAQSGATYSATFLTRATSNQAYSALATGKSDVGVGVKVRKVHRIVFAEGVGPLNQVNGHRAGAVVTERHLGR